ncbi:DnaJ-domain-containing protein [Exidia glandulosa HHB12029]|uniref:DnaJ-domain-containing protein n=1 Tax=Exidia glandulosa HHB12029 TaxID=1314781 RepID=A0A165BD17_EXIGL|nr:DnaJ-domain-containing protein [Exidia glandulosa HHB12029]
MDDSDTPSRQPITMEDRRAAVKRIKRLGAQADHYDVLDVADDCDELDIKKAYKKLVLLVHPDKTNGDVPGAEEAFKAVRKAYEVLSDVRERAVYDGGRFELESTPPSSTSDRTSNYPPASPVPASDPRYRTQRPPPPPPPQERRQRRRRDYTAQKAGRDAYEYAEREMRARREAEEILRQDRRQQRQYNPSGWTHWLSILAPISIILIAVATFSALAYKGVEILFFTPTGGLSILVAGAAVAAFMVLVLWRFTDTVPITLWQATLTSLWCLGMYHIVIVPVSKLGHRGT